MDAGIFYIISGYIKNNDCYMICTLQIIKNML